MFHTHCFCRVCNTLSKGLSCKRKSKSLHQLICTQAITDLWESHCTINSCKKYFHLTLHDSPLWLCWVFKFHFIFQWTSLAGLKMWGKMIHELKYNKGFVWWEYKQQIILGTKFSSVFHELAQSYSQMWYTQNASLQTSFISDTSPPSCWLAVDQYLQALRAKLYPYGNGQM